MVRVAACLSVFALLLIGCSDRPPACGSGAERPMLAFELFFGRAVPERGDVSEAEWVDFVDGTVAAALPDGFTVFDARGAWFSPRAGRTIHEATKVILVALPNLPESRETVERVRSVYQTRFRQQLVGMIVQPVCGAF